MVLHSTSRTGGVVLDDVRFTNACASERTSRNNDHLNFNASAEDLNLDWRYSRGLGVPQQTLFPAASDQIAAVQPFRRWCKAGVPSREYGGECFTARDLVSPEGGILSGVLRAKKGGATAGRSPDPMTFWRDWGGGHGSAAEQKEYGLRSADVRACSEKNVAASFLGASRCRGDAPLSRKQCVKESADRVKQGLLGYRCDVQCPDFARMPVKQRELTN